jgi:hypothetical protein
MTQLAPSFTVMSAGPRLSTGQAWKGLAKNAAIVVAQQSESVLQNPGSFKNNALILSSLILVISRILVASLSAVKARGTPDAQYRYQESIRTGIREVGGFLSSFGLLMAITLGLKAGMRHVWGIPPEKGYPFFQNLKKAFQERHDPHFSLSEPNYYLDADNAFRYEPKKAAGFIKMVNGCRGWFNKQALSGKAEKAFLKATYTWTPIVVAGAVALHVSGKLLERFTKKHSADVVNWISRRSGGSAPAPGGSRAQKSSVAADSPNLPPPPPVPITGSPSGTAVWSGSNGISPMPAAVPPSGSFHPVQTL